MGWSDTTTIDAPAALVWRLTTKVEDWPSLTPRTTWGYAAANSSQYSSWRRGDRR